MAASYLFHLCQNHAFIDGNKRVGTNAAITFLLINDWEPTFDETELVGLVRSRRSNPAAVQPAIHPAQPLRSDRAVQRSLKTAYQA
jgi:death on curing protein